MDKQEEKEIKGKSVSAGKNEIDPFLFFAIMVGILTVQSDNKKEPEE